LEAVDLLETLGLDPGLYQQTVAPCSEILSYWGSEQAYVRDSLQHPSGLGLLLKRPEFDCLVADFVRDSGVSVLAGARAKHLERVGVSWMVHFQQNDAEGRETVDYLVDASGRNSRFASTLGTRKIKYDKLIALNVKVPVFSARDILQVGSIIVEPHAHGWIYAAGLPGGMGIVSAVMDGESVHREASKRETFREMLAETRIAKALTVDNEIMDELTPCSCQSQLSSSLFGEGWLLVGDTAWSADPLSAQGMLKAIRDGLDAANVINSMRQGDERALASYQSRIRSDFRAYLVERSKYYRREQRWSEHPFWRRRHFNMISGQKITIDPHETLDFSSVDLSPILDQLEVAIPSIDRSLLTEILRKPARAFEMVTSYQQYTRSPIGDREVIVALQAVQQWIVDSQSGTLARKARSYRIKLSSEP
jgi:flavin-dependent dehydrogenase